LLLVWTGLNSARMMDYPKGDVFMVTRPLWEITDDISEMV